MIATSSQLARELSAFDDNFVLVEYGGKEYVIDCIGHSKTSSDIDYSSHLLLKIRDGGDGYIKR